ncbi:MAG: gliding motility-associated ABC transporter substrate-binding protein GldG [Paludibacteraceae bacterium]|nr:gliding motility-associated ABC transporter substrate-binding protein GldG [Paludibacteraceae bacterium]MBQ2607714.1 gliding motility-associated ABC transporter substrate-binding protein GldG [Paludibacteraceae bacterium]
MAKVERYIWLGVVALLVAAAIVARLTVVRVDMTDDRHYTLGRQTKQLLQSLDEPIEVTLYLDGDLNAGFRKLKAATEETLDEFRIYASVRRHTFDADKEKMPNGLQPTIVHERQHNGKTAQTPVYPYAKVSYKGRYTIVALLNNNRQLSGEENLNVSIENLEYTLAEAISELTRKETPKVAFIEGHQELPEQHVADIEELLRHHFQVDRGQIGLEPEALQPYRVLIIADPQTRFSEEDKYCLDQYLMQGGRILWVLNGVQFSDEVLSKSGFTPVLPLDLNLQDMLFRYGIRIQPALLQDVQCLPIPVNVSQDPKESNLQPMPWYYAPLLLTSQESPVTKNVTQVSCSFASPIEPVGGEDGIKKDVLLATSTASRVIPTPAEVDLSDLNPDMSTFRYQYIPVAVALQGEFPSIFAHRMRPDSIRTSMPQREQSIETRQIVVASGSIIRNDIEKGQALPAGYDRYSGMQFGNRDFITNAVLYLADSEGLIGLRQKKIDLHLLNQKRSYAQRTQIQLVSTLLPIAVLALVGLVVLMFRKRKYTKKTHIA